MRLDEAPDQLAAVLVARQFGRERRQERPLAAQPAMLDEDGAGKAHEHPVRRPGERIVGALRLALPRREQASFLVLDAVAPRLRAASVPGAAEQARQTLRLRSGPGLARVCGQARRQLGLDQVQGLSAQLVVRLPDLGHARLEVAGQDRAGDPAKIDAEILVRGTIRNGDVGGDADQQFVDDQSLGPERDEFHGLEAGERAALVRLVEAGERVLGPVDGRERQQGWWQLRPDPRIPGAVLGAPLERVRWPGRPCRRL